MSAHPRRPAVPARSLADLATRAGLLIPQSDVTVTGVTLDSHSVTPGDLFAALPGAHAHGADHLVEAIARGAVATLTDARGAARAAELGLPALVAADPRSVLGMVAAEVFGNPAEDLMMLGVTGTNGKTTATWLLESGARACDQRTGLIGTVTTRIGEVTLPAVRTTPEAPDLQALLARMREAAVDCVAMEVSSHALAQGRVDGVQFDVAAFTNLTQDHLDFHGDMEHYFAAKAELFTPARARSSVVVVDDVWGRRLAECSSIPVITVSATGDRSAADWTGSATRSRADGGTDLVAHGPGNLTLDLSVRLPGRYNVTNALTALAMLAGAGLDPVAAAAGIGACPGVPGRLESIDRGQPFLVVVDYAHTPDAVAGVLAILRDGSSGRLLAVVGAGGDRDRDKRPLLGSAAAQGADVVWVTDDNPRREDPAAIRAAVLSGALETATRSGATVIEMGDRRAAIAAAIREAQVGDVLVVAGKGHETGQEVGGVVHPFDDRVVVAEELAARGARP